MVAFHPVPTNKQEDRWRDMAGQIAALVSQLRVHEADNGRPGAEDYPEVVAAVEASYIDWNTAIRQVLAKSLGRPVTANAVLKDFQVSKPVRCSPDEPLDLERVRVRLSQGASKGWWKAVDVGPGRVGYVLPTEAHAPQVVERPSGSG